MPKVVELATEAVQTIIDAYSTSAKTLVTPVYNVKGYGAKGDGVTDDTAAIQAAIASTPDKGVLYIPADDFLFTNTLVFDRPIHVVCDGRLLYAATGVAVDIRCVDSRFDGLYVRGTQTEPADPSQLTGTGIRIYGAKNVTLINPRVEVMQKGIHLLGPSGGTGYIWGYNPIVTACQSAIEFGIETGGWCNETAWSGGRLAGSAAWTVSTGTRFINITGDGNNSHRFFAMSLEGTPERKLYCAGDRNEFIACRWEGSNGTADIEFTSTSRENAIIGGYFIEGQKITDAGSYNNVFGKIGEKFHGVRDISFKNMTASGYVGNEHVILVDASAGPVTVQVYEANTMPGRVYMIKKIDSSTNAVTLARRSSDLIDGAVSYSLTTQYQSVTIFSDGVSGWHVIGKV